MAYGLIQVDKVENSDGKSLNVGPSARVFDTVTDLQASTTLSDGDIVIVKERANAEYKIQPTGYTTLDGDLTLISGQVAELQLKPETDIRWFGVVGDGSDEQSSLGNALYRSASENVWLSGYGLTVGCGGRLYLQDNCKVSNLTIEAVGDFWADNGADIDSLVVGLPLVTVSGKSGVKLNGVILECGLTTIDTENEDVASAGFYFYGNSSVVTLNCQARHYNGYAFYAKDKHGSSRHYGFTCSQWLWGESGWFDTSLRTAYGMVNASGDWEGDLLTSFYNKSNFHIIDGAFTTLWGRTHPFNGSDASESLDNITMTGGVGQVFGDMYLDNGYITLTGAFGVQFNNIRHVKNENASNNSVFRLIATDADETAKGLYVGNVVIASNEFVTYSTSGSGTWSDSKEHIFASVSRNGEQSNSVVAYPHLSHTVVQTYGGRHEYGISTDGGSLTVNQKVGLFGVRDTSFGALFSGVKLGNVGEILIAGNPDDDVTVQPTLGEAFARLQLSGSNGTDFGTTANSDIGRAQITAHANEDWSSTSMGTYLQFKITGDGGTTTVTPLTLTSTSVNATGDDTFSLGVSYSRWTQVYATNSTINTSDARLKTDLTELTDDEVNAAVAISKAMGYTWQWLENGDRTHTGPTVQLIMGIMEDNNLEPFDYSFICYDEWDDKTEKVEVTPEVLDDDGNVVTEAVYEDQVIVEAGNRYSFREGELIKFCNAGLSARLDSQQETIDSILLRLDSLEGQ